MSNFINTAPYWDDALNAIANGYVQILFRPEYAVQSRELTQSQSLLRNQIEQIGDFLFENGSVVSGGHITFDNTVYGVQIQANDNISLNDFDGQLLINSSGPVTTRAVCVTVDSSVSSNTVEGALILKYLSGQEFADGQQLSISTGVLETATLLNSNSTYRASIASINEGVFYVDGYFVTVPKQTIVLDSTSPFPSARIGLQIQTAVVDESTDSTLLDPAQGSFNYEAPGATRYQYQLVLSSRDLNSPDDSAFFELLRVENGVITNQVNYPVLGTIENALAQRIYDTNGNFVVKPFIVSAVDDPNSPSNFILQVGAGKGFVSGYEFETIAPTKIIENKALSTNTSNDYIFTTEFGNYLTVTNLNSGNIAGFNTGNFGNVDLHLVPSANINTSNVAEGNVYTYTKIGTAQIRNIEYSGTNQWLAYVLNVNIPSMTVNAAATSSNTTSVKFPNDFTTSANALVGVPFTVIAGTSSGDSRVITSYDASARVGYLNLPTTQLLDTSSQLSLQFGIKDVNSLVVTPTVTGNVFATQNTESGEFACMDIDINGGKNPDGNTVLFDTNYNKLIFPLPQSYIEQDSFYNVSFMNRKTLTTVAFTSGNATIATGSGLDSSEQFDFGYTNAYISDQLAKNNFLVVVRNSQTSNLANGTVLTWDKGSNPGGNGVYQSTATSVTIDTVTSGNFLADILLTVQDINASVNFRRTKTLVGSYANDTLLTTDSYINGTAVVGTANANSVYLDTANGYCWFTNWGDINKNPGAIQSLYVSDVIGIVKVYTSGSPSYAPNTTNAVDVTSSYLFNSGQKDNYYDHSFITLKAGEQPPSGQTVVMFQYWAHDNTSGYFSVDSYDSGSYANNYIPVFNSEKFGSINLRDSIDFRPTRTIGTQANVANFNLNGLRLPQPDSSMIASYAYYLPRFDKLILTKDRQFHVIQGVPSLDPQLPPDQPGSMVLYNISLDPYTYFSGSNVQLQYQENKRYTMQDIGTLDSRLSQVEYYVTLNQLETTSLKTSVLYQDGVTVKTQYGIVTDNFVDYSVADTTDPDLLCYIGNGNLTPYQNPTTIEYSYNSSTGSFSNNKRTITLPYTETPVIIQNTASDYTQIQPYAFGQFQGEIILEPQSDIWYSQNLIPQLSAVIEIPIVDPTPVVVANSTVGITTNSNNTNPAKLTPPTVTTPPPPKPTPVTGSTVTTVTKPPTYCYPTYNWKYTYGDMINGYQDVISGFYPGNSYYRGRYYYGTLCRTIPRSTTGYGINTTQNTWVPKNTSQPSNKTTPAPSTGVVTNPYYTAPYRRIGSMNLF